MTTEMISFNQLSGWIGVSFAVVFYFYFIMSRGDAADKRKWFPFLTFALGAIFFGLSLWTLSTSGTIYPLLCVPLVYLTGFMMIKITKFCDGCGSAAPAYVSFRNVKCCPRCKKQFATSKI